MTTYYVDTTVSGGSDDGSSWANAWNDLQAAIDKPLAAGDVVLCYSNGYTNRETPAATIDFDGTSGNTTSGYIKFIGCSTNTGDGSPDGTKYVLDGGGARSPLAAITSDYIWIENFRFTNAFGDGVAAASASDADYWVWINCDFDNNGDDGFSGELSVPDYHYFIGCKFFGNSYSGCEWGGNYFVFVNCVAYQNGAEGIGGIGGQAKTLVRCLSYDNGDSQPNVRLINDSLMDSCIVDGTNQASEDGVYLGNDRVYILASRITNCAEGINAVSNLGVVGWCLFDGNSDDTSNDTLLYHLPFESDLDLSAGVKGVFSEGNPSGSTNKFDPDADDGYNSAGDMDYGLKADRTYNGDGSDTVGFNVGS